MNDGGAELTQVRASQARRLGGEASCSRATSVPLLCPELAAYGLNWRKSLQTDDLHIEELHQLALAIDRDMPDERMDARAIARFQTGLIQFMENALGPNVSVSRFPLAERLFATVAHASEANTGSIQSHNENFAVDATKTIP